MENGMAFMYIIIHKSNNMCFQTIQTNTKNWSIDNENDYSIQVDIQTTEYIGKYYYASEGSIGKTWWERTWNDYDENGNPIEESGYRDTPWIPSNE